MNKQFPRTTVGGISVSRMLMGSNWLLGWSHTGEAADNMIKSRYDSYEKFMPMLETYLSYGVDTIMAPFTAAESNNPGQVLVRAIRETEQKTGKKIIMVDTPYLNVDNTPEGRKKAEAVVKKCKENGSSIVLMHHGCCEQLVNKNKRIIDRLDDYTKMIRDAGMVPGLSAHMPEMVTYSDLNEYDVETYIQIFNPMGFLMQVEVESVAKIINNAKKPVMTIKSMAAGRCTPYVGLTFVWNAIRDCDMVTLGAFSPDEIHEDVEISLAALEHRFPKLGKRSSPVANQAAFGLNNK